MAPRMNHGKRLCAAAMAVAAGLAAAGIGAPPPPAGAGERDPTPPLAPASLASNEMAVRWHSQALLTPNTHLTDLWIRGGYLVGHGSDHRVYVMDAETGVRLWSADLSDAHETLWPPAVHRDHLWFATTTRLMGFQGSNGKNIVEEVLTPAHVLAASVQGGEGEEPASAEPAYGKVPEAQRRAEAEIARLERCEAELKRLLAADKQAIALDFAPSGPPVAGGSHVFVPDAKGWLQAVAIRPHPVSWGRWTEDAVTAGPVVDDARVYFAGHNGMVYASAQDVRRILWHYQTEGAIIADLRLTDTGTVLVGSTDYSLYAFNGTSGVLEWNQLPNHRYNAGEPIRKPPYTFGGQVFLFTRGAGLTVLDTATGRVQWQLKDGSNLITADAKTVYVLSRGNDLLAVNRETGKVRFAIPLRQGTLIGINETGTGILYFSSADGHVWAIAKAAEPETPAGEE